MSCPPPLALLRFIAAVFTLIKDDAIHTNTSIE